MDNNENNNRRDDEQNNEFHNDELHNTEPHNDERYNDGYYTEGDDGSRLNENHGDDRRYGDSYGGNQGYGNGFDNGDNANGYNGYDNNGRYYANDRNDRNGYGGGGYGYNGGNAQGGAKAKVSNKLLISAVAVLAVTLIAAIIGVSIFYINVIKPIIEEPNNGGTPSIPTNTGIVDPEFNISQSTSGPTDSPLADAYEKTSDIFVEINVETNDGISAGSGFILSKTNDGTGYYIVTNNHVVEGATKISVRLTSGEYYTADTKILTDELSDLAVITIRETAELSVAKLGKSSTLRTGESVYVIGNPLGTLACTLTNGIISQTATEITVNGHLMSLLQTTAAINPGNSGGPMFNMAGGGGGIIKAKYVSTDVEGIGFAIPIDSALVIVKQMIQQGYVTGRNDLGITTTYGNYGFGNGLWITEWDENSSLLAYLTENKAYNSGYYYQIHSIDGKEFTSDTQANLYIDELEAGKTVTIVISAYYYTPFYGPQNPINQQTIQITLGQLSALQDTGVTG